MGSVPGRGISHFFQRQDVGTVFFFPPFGKTKGSLLLLLMYFCSSLNKKLWFLKGSEAGRGEVACRGGHWAFRLCGLFSFCLWRTGSEAVPNKLSLSPVGP